MNKFHIKKLDNEEIPKEISKEINEHLKSMAKEYDNRIFNDICMVLAKYRMFFTTEDIKELFLKATYFDEILENMGFDSYKGVKTNMAKQKKTMSEIKEAFKIVINGESYRKINNCTLAEYKRYEKLIQELIDNHEKYRWHDLIKDPTDLPNNYETVLCYSPKIGYVLLYRKDDWWRDCDEDYFYTTTKASTIVNKWRYIDDE